MLDKQLFYQCLFDQAQLYREIDKGHFRSGSGWAVHYSEGSSLPSGVLAKQDDPSLHSQLETLVGEVEAAHATPAIKIVGKGAPKLVEQAHLLGFTQKMTAACMVLRRKDLRPLKAPGLSFRPIDVQTQWSIFSEIVCSSFGFTDEVLQMLNLQGLAHNGVIAILLGEVDGRTVTTASLFTSQKVASISNVATRFEHRGLGYGGAVVTYVSQLALAAGVKLVTLEAAPNAISLYKRVGFQQIGTSTTFVRPTSH